MKYDRNRKIRSLKPSGLFEVALTRDLAQQQLSKERKIPVSFVGILQFNKTRGKSFRRSGFSAPFWFFDTNCTKSIQIINQRFIYRLQRLPQCFDMLSNHVTTLQWTRIIL